MNLFFHSFFQKLDDKNKEVRAYSKMQILFSVYKASHLDRNRHHEILYNQKTLKYIHNYIICLEKLYFIIF